MALSQMHRSRTPSALGFEFGPWMKRILVVRTNRPASYAISVALVLAAIGIRWIIDPFVGTHVPFTTFYPAVFAAALIGGLGPAMLAIALAALAAWYIFMPPAFSFALEQSGDAEILLFVVVNAVNVFIATLISNMVDRLAAQQRNVLLLLDSAPNGLAVVDENGLIILANASLGRLLGYEAEELKGEPIDDLLEASPKEAPGVQAEPGRSGPQGSERQRSIAHGNGGSVIPVDVRLDPIGKDGRHGQLASVFDLTVQQGAEESRKVIENTVSELDMEYLATLRGIAGALAKRAGSAEELARLITLRVERLARAIGYLPKGSKTVSLASLVERPRIAFDGDDIRLPLKMARQFAIILGELESNALLHGALSTPGGQVIVRPDIEGHWLMFLWAETGGPPAASPGDSGFGTFVLQDMATQFGYDVSMQFTPRGFTYLLRANLSEFGIARGEARSGVDPGKVDRRRAAG